MKKLFLYSVLLIALIIGGCAEKKKPNNVYDIRGIVDIDSLNGKYVYLFPSVSQMDSAIATAEIVDNKFHIHNNILINPYSAPLVVGDKYGKILLPYIGSSIVIEPGDIRIKIKKNGVTEVSGTPLNDMFYTCEYATIQFDSLCVDLSKKDLQSAIKIAKLDSLKRLRANTIFNALLPNINSEVTNEILNVTYLYLYSDHLEQLVERRDQFVRVGYDLNFVEQASNTAIGDKYVDVTLKTVEGDSLKLSDFIGKSEYILIEYWASWCGPCLRAMPKLRDIYNKTSRSKFDIVAISLDKDANAWKNAIEHHNLKWTHLSSLKAWDCESTKKYAIKFIPSTVLIDKNGIIISRNPSVEELYIFLK